jgi:(R)-2-hydroxyacyl-CoA dehydratese activating ATPase
MITCGIDIGSTTIEVVLLRSGEPVGSGMTLCGPAPAANAVNLLDSVLLEAGIARAEVARTVATGFGRNYCAFADGVASEIRCHATGVVRRVPGVRTVIEIGGQDAKMIQLGEGGRVLEFLMNDRCAAGTGRFIETVARTLGVTVEQTGPLALASEVVCEINSMCTVFAESEIVGLLHRGETPGAILRGVFLSVARRMRGMVGRFVVNGQVVFTGGVARNSGVVLAMREVLGREVLVPEEPEYTGALGAAILAARGQAT